MELQAPGLDIELPAGGWRPAALTLLVHLAFFSLLFVGLHWRRSLPPADDGAVWLMPADMLVQEAKPDVENAASDEPATKNADINVGGSGISDASEKSAKPTPATAPQSRPADAAAGQADKRANKPQDGDGDSKADDGASSDIRLSIATTTVFEVTGAQRETNMAVEFALSLRPDGTISELQVTKSSGNPDFDEAVRQGIVTAQPYPRKLAAKSPDVDVTIRALDVDIMHRFPATSSLP